MKALLSCEIAISIALFLQKFRKIRKQMLKIAVKMKDIL